MIRIAVLRSFSRRFGTLATARSDESLQGVRQAQSPGAFYPRPTGPQGPAAPRKASWMPVTIFTLANVLPLAAVAYYLKRSIEERQAELERISDLSSLAPAEVAARMESISRSCSSSILIAGDSISPIIPHSPESSPLVLTTDDIVNNIDSTIPGTAGLFDSITATRDASVSAPLSCVHFGLSAKSAPAKNLTGGKNRAMTVVYTGGPVSDVTVSVIGMATVIEDERLRRFYWKDRWAAWIGSEDYLLVKLAPSEVRLSSLNGGAEAVDGVRLVRDGNEWKRV